MRLMEALETVKGHCDRYGCDDCSLCAYLDCALEEDPCDWDMASIKKAVERIVGE